MQNLIQRVLSAIVLTVLLALVLIYPQYYIWLGIVLVCSFIVLWECKKIISGSSLFIFDFILCTFFIHYIVYFNPTFNTQYGLLEIILYLILACWVAIFSLMIAQQINKIFKYKALLSLILILMIMSLHTLIYYSQIVSLFIIVIMTDIGGYVFGKLWGNHSFSKYSPKKTWEGFAGGLILSSVAIIVLYYFIMPHFQWQIIPFTLFISTVSSYGDIFQSTIKRYFKVKDSGAILPGHGGMYDRIDGLIASIPFYLLISEYFRNDLMLI